MTRVNAVLVLILAFSSVCFGASLMKNSMARSSFNASEKLAASSAKDLEKRCRALVKEEDRKTTTKIAEELYKRAYSLSFNGDWSSAKAASFCAAHLLNGSDHWAFEAKDLFGFLH